MAISSRVGDIEDEKRIRKLIPVVLVAISQRQAPVRRLTETGEVEGADMPKDLQADAPHGLPGDPPPKTVSCNSAKEDVGETGGAVGRDNGCQQRRRECRRLPVQ